MRVIRVRAASALSAAILVGLCVRPIGLTASLSGPPPAHTGGFGEMSCHQCHFDNPLNDAVGRLTLSGLPATYTPGEEYLITVTIGRPEMKKAGFQLSAREDVLAMNAGADAGELRATDELSEPIKDDTRRVTYLQQTRAGADVKRPDMAQWTFRWTAPEHGAVIFHVAANAAGGDDSPLGDYIYTLEARTRAE